MGAEGPVGRLRGFLGGRGLWQGEKEAVWFSDRS